MSDTVAMLIRLQKIYSGYFPGDKVTPGKVFPADQLKSNKNFNRAQLMSLEQRRVQQFMQDS
jgi:hypothetical protein